MPSFAAISLFATIALTSFTSAAPVGPIAGVPVPAAPAGLPVPIPAVANGAVGTVTGVVDSTVGGVTGGVVGTVTNTANGVTGGAVGTVTDTANGVIAAVAVPKSLAVVFSEATSALNPVLGQLTAIKGDAIEVATITPVTNEVTAIIQKAVDATKALQGQPISVIMASANGAVQQISIPDLATIVAGLLSLVLGALASVLKEVSLSGKLDVITPILAAVGGLLSVLVSLVVGLVGAQLLPALAPLIQGLIPTINSLGLIQFANSVAI